MSYNAGMRVIRESVEGAIDRFNETRLRRDLARGVDGGSEMAEQAMNTAVEGLRRQITIKIGPFM